MDVDVQVVEAGEPPDPVALVARGLGVVLDQPVLGELAQVEARLVGRDVEQPRDVGGAHRTRGAELGEDPVAQRMGDRAQHGRVVDVRAPAHPTKLRTFYCAMNIAHYMLRDMPGHRSLARNRDFTALWVGQTASILGSRISMFVFPLLTYALTGSAVLAAAAEALHLLGLAAVLLPAGVLADRYDRRLLMRAASGSGVVLYASLAIALVLGAGSVPHIFVVALLTGVATGVFLPAETAAVRSVVAPDDLPTALSQNQGREHVAALVGAPIGGALYAVTRWLPFAVDAVTYAISFVLLGRIRTDLRAPGPGASLGATGARRRRPVRDAAPLLPHLGRLGGAHEPRGNALFFVAVLRLIEAGTDPVHLGLVETIGGAAGIVGAIVAPAVIERLSTGGLTVAVAWSGVVLVVPLAMWSHWGTVAAALAVILLLNPAGNAGMQAYRISMTPPELLGRAQSFSQFVSMSLMPLAPVCAGLALAAFGGRDATLLMGVLCVVVALIPTLSRTIRSVPRPAVWRAALERQARMEPCPRETASGSSLAGSTAS